MITDRLHFSTSFLFSLGGEREVCIGRGERFTLLLSNVKIL